MDVDLLELVIKTWKGSTEGKLVSVAAAQGPRSQSRAGARGACRGLTLAPRTIALLLLPRLRARACALPALALLGCGDWAEPGLLWVTLCLSPATREELRPGKKQGLGSQLPHL